MCYQINKQINKVDHSVQFNSERVTLAHCSVVKNGPFGLTV